MVGVYSMSHRTLRTVALALGSLVASTAAMASQVYAATEHYVLLEAHGAEFAQHVTPSRQRFAG